MLNKTIKTGSMEVLNQCPFTVGSEYLLNGVKIRVMEQYVDTTVDFRKVFSEGSESIYELKTLQSMAAEDINFKEIKNEN